MQRRWTVELTDREGGQHTLTVEVPEAGNGVIFTRAGWDGRSYRIEPETLARIRKVFADALAVALQDRAGQW